MWKYHSDRQHLYYILQVPKNLMTGAISKLHQFVLYTWAITRSYTCYKSGKKCTFRKIITNNLMRLFIRVGYIAFDLRLRYFFGHKRKRYRRCITFLFIQNIPFNCFPSNRAGVPVFKRPRRKPHCFKYAVIPVQLTSLTRPPTVVW